MEEWREVLSCPGYAVNSHGEVRGRRGWKLSPSKSAGYLRVKVCDGNGGVRLKGVHAMICEAFHGPAPSPFHEPAHWDNNRSNNSPNNLRWATRRENHADKRRHGTHLAGERHGRAKLTAREVAEMRALFAAAPRGLRVRRGTLPTLAQRFGVSIHLVKDVVHGRSWRGEAQ